MRIDSIGFLECPFCRGQVEVAAVMEHVAHKHKDPLCEPFLRIKRNDMNEVMNPLVEKLIAEKGIKTQESPVLLGAGPRIGVKVVP